MFPLVPFLPWWQNLMWLSHDTSSSTDLNFNHNFDDFCQSHSNILYLLMFFIFNQIFRYKYLEKMHEEEMRKILVYLNGFTDEERLRLAEIIAVWLAAGQIQPSTLSVLIKSKMEWHCNFSWIWWSHYRSVKFRMNLWGQRFSQNANQKFKH